MVLIAWDQQEGARVSVVEKAFAEQFTAIIDHFYIFQSDPRPAWNKDVQVNDLPVLPENCLRCA
jgi:hypothetical protein